MEDGFFDLKMWVLEWFVFFVCLSVMEFVSVFFCVFEYFVLVGGGFGGEFIVVGEVVLDELFIVIDEDFVNFREM